MLDLPPASHAPGSARRAVEQLCAGVLQPDELDAAKLLTSELVTNAVVHGTGAIRLSADLDDDRFVVSVFDEGTGFEHQPRSVSCDEANGLGLAIVDAESRRWGISESCARVWFEIERAASTPRAQAIPKHLTTNGNRRRIVHE